MSKKSKGNKQILEGINYSMEVVKKAKSDEHFTQLEKEEILDKFVGMSSDNNSYFTPDSVTSLIKNLIDVKSGKIADLSAGIGSMVKPFISEYGKLQEGIQFDLYELDENNSYAGNVAWSDYEKVDYIGNYNTIERCDEIPDNYYDCIVGNPPFSGSVKYLCDWNKDKKGNAKNTNICDSFVDMAIKKVKSGGLIALVLPMGHLFKGKSTAKLREFMKENVAIKAVIPLNSETFIESGVKGTTVTTVLVIMQKEVRQSEIFMGVLQDKKDLISEMDSLAFQYRLMQSREYEVMYASDSSSGMHGLLEPSVSVWGGSI